MAIDPANTDTITVAELPSLELALSNFFAHSNVNGKLYKATLNELATFIAPYVSAIGASPYVATTGTVLSNPTDKNTALTFVGAGTFTQTTGGNIVTTQPLNLLSWNGTTWTLTLAISIDLTNYVPKSDIVNDLTTGGATKPLSAEQGKQLYERIKVFKYQFPYLNEQTGLAKDVSAAIKELYLGDYDNTYDYILTSVRRNANLPSLPTGRYSIKVVKVNKGTTTAVETLEWLQYNRVEPNGLDYIKFGFLNIIIDWTALTNPFDFAVANSLTYILDSKIGDLKSNPEINEILNGLVKTDRFKLQDSAVPDDSQLIDHTPYLQKGQLNSSGVFIKNSDLLTIVAMPTFADYIYFAGVASTAQRKLIYLDSGKNPVSITLLDAYPNTPILINTTYPYFSLTVLTPFDLTSGLTTSFRMFKNSTGVFELSKISGINIKNTDTDLSNYYNKSETDSLLSGGLSTKADKATTYTKAETDSEFLSKDDAIALYAPKTDIDTINEALSNLEGSVPDGAIAGDNTWLGSNIFSQPIKGVNATADNEIPTYGQIKNALYRTRNAADYGVLPGNTSAVNTSNLQSALDGGNIELHFTEAGEYLLNDVVYLDDNTTIRVNTDVLLKRDALYGVMIANRGLLTRTRNKKITLSGFNVSANDKEYTYANSSILYGIRGLISMIGVEDLIIENYDCIDGGTDNWHIQVTDFDNIEIRGINMKGHKDGIHLGRGNNFYIHHIKAAVYDDTVALNAFDYSMSNPTIGDISNGLIENVEDLVNEWDYSSNFSRMLVGALTDWVPDIETRNGDAFVHNGKVYRAITNFTGTPITSVTEPTIATFTGVQTTSEGIIWKLIQNDAVYTANIDNVTYRNITHDPVNGRFLSVEYDGNTSIYNRSIHSTIPVSDYPTASNVRVEKLKSKYGYIDVKQDLYYSIYLSEWNNRVQAKMLDFKSTVNKGYLSLRNMNLRGLNGGVTIGTGANIVLRDNNIGDLTAFNFGVSGCRVNSNTSMTLAETNLTPLKGDEVIVNGAKKIYTGSAWNSLN